MRYFVNSLQTIKKKPKRIIWIQIYLAMFFITIKCRTIIWAKIYNNFQFEEIDRLIIIVQLMVSTVIGICLIIILGYPNNNFFVRRRLEKIGIKNKCNEIPILVRYKNVGKYQVYLFKTMGIPRDYWEDRKSDLEATFDICISSIEYKNGHKYVEIEFVDAIDSIPTLVKWNQDYLDETEFMICLGEGMTGTVKANLAKNNSVLIGGSTGSGKTILLKSILIQCIYKGAIVYIVDFKGGLDYSAAVWKEKVKFATTKDEVCNFLEEIQKEMLRRQSILLKAGKPNICEYNEVAENKLQHIIFAFDEIAELLDRTGLSREEKATVAEIEGMIATIARMGRAYGVHLVLATQRPDANVIAGQIKNNIDIRICGRADNVLSQIILDNTSASTEIRKNQQGRFIMSDGTKFQGYYHEDI